MPYGVFGLFCSTASRQGFSRRFWNRRPPQNIGDASVEQWLTGTLVLRLKSTWFVEQSDRLEITFDGGKSWENIDERKLDSCYYENIEDRHIGKRKIAIRIAADEEKAQGKKSNIVKFNVKKPSEFYQYMIQGDILDIGELELGQYASELQDDAIRLKNAT